MNSILNKVTHFIYESRPVVFCTTLWCLSLLKVGVWFIPNVDAYQAISFNPFVNPYVNLPDAHYLFWSWLEPFLAWVFRIKSLGVFIAFLGLFTVIFSALFMYLVFKKLPSHLARTALVLFTILPVSMTAYFWISMDGMTLLLLLCALAFPEFVAITLFSGVLLGMQHFEQSFIASALLFGASCLNNHYGTKSDYLLRFSALLMSAIVLGKLILIGLFYHYSIHLNSGRLYYLIQHARAISKACFLHAYDIIWSALGLGWLIALRYADKGRQAIPFFCGILAALSVGLIVQDHARVFAIVTFPLILAYWLFNRDFLSSLTKQEVSLIFVIWLIMPWGWFWGSIKSSVFFYDIALVLNRAFGWISLPKNLGILPFE